MEPTLRPPFARPSADDPYLRALKERVVIFDGATGTNLQLQNLSADDFGGAALEGCNEILSITRPDVVESLHRSFFDVGVDAVETDSFGTFSVVLAEYGIAERTHELALASAQIARRVADSYASPGSPRFVAGSMGPGTKFPSLGQITYDDLSASYEEMALGLLEGGVDLLIVETVYDLLSGKAAIAACHRAMVRHGRVVPIQAQVTIELTGRMLPGTEIGAALTSLSPLGVDVFGLNCATGPVEMYEPLRHLSESSPMPLSCLPNAGLPSVVDGKMHYDLTPDALAEHLSKFVTEYGVQIVGGCCGTTPEHVARVIEAVRPLTPAVRTAVLEPAVASIYSATNYQQDRSVLLVGERTNANGSKKFRDAMLEGDWDACVGIGRDQIKEGAHILDVCVDYTGADGVADMNELMSRLATQSSVPIMVDTTETKVARQALTWLGGKALLNSVNLEEGDGPGTRLDGFLTLAAEFGAAIVATCIDEVGQARTAEWKVRAARAITELAVSRYRLDEEARRVCLDLIYDRRSDDYDPLTVLLGLYEGVSTSNAATSSLDDLELNDRLRRRIIDGARVGLESDLDAAMAEGMAPLDIVNQLLLDGMREVGDLFASGEMQLPFVLQSAETMKSAVAHLEPHMEKSDQGGRGRVVLATVKGDVHDIGKNLVDIILTNNGYEVFNLGIKVGVNEMLSALEEHHADALGMSGLLVKSTLIMRENLALMNERGMSHVPVLLGGAALTRTYVERDLRQVYSGRVFYGKDAFEGLRVLDRLGELRRGDEEDLTFGREISERKVFRRIRGDAGEAPEGLPSRSPDIEDDNPLFTPPFLGSRVAKGMSVDEISEYLLSLIHI